MITVSQSAVSSGHSRHDGNPATPIWTTSSVQGEVWGDIIPNAASGGPNGKENNWTTAGIAIYKGLTINPSNGSPVCKKMSLKAFYDGEIGYWSRRIPNDEYELYNAPIDTTFCLINTHYNGDDAIRVAGRSQRRAVREFTGVAGLHGLRAGRGRAPDAHAATAAVYSFTSIILSRVKSRTRNYFARKSATRTHGQR